MYDLDKINVTISNEGTIVHVYSDRNKPTAERSIFMLYPHSAMISVIEGNPLGDDFEVKEVFRPVTRQEAEDLLSYLFHARILMGQGLIREFDTRKVRFKAKNSTFWVRFASEALPTSSETLTESAAKAMVRDYKEAMR